MTSLMQTEVCGIVPKEYQGTRVVTFKDIDQAHGRPEGTARRNFNQNKKHFKDGCDYFLLTPASMYEFRTLEIPPKGLTVFTQSGYLMLVKSFTDKKSWEVQRHLVDSYFNKAPVVQPLPTSPGLSPELQMVQALLANAMKTEQAIVQLSQDVQALKAERKAPPLALPTAKTNMPAPKVRYTTTAIAEAFAITPRTLNQFLEIDGIATKINKSWLLTQNYADKGYMYIRYSSFAGKEKPFCWWTEDGKNFMVNYLKSKNLIQIKREIKPYQRKGA